MDKFTLPKSGAAKTKFGYDLPHTVDGLYHAVKEALDMIVEMQEAQKWIPVSGELPEHGALVLTSTEGDGYAIDYITTAGMFTADHPVLSGPDVSFWMPLPTPPSTEGSSNE